MDYIQLLAPSTTDQTKVLCIVILRRDLEFFRLIMLEDVVSSLIQSRFFEDCLDRTTEHKGVKWKELRNINIYRPPTHLIASLVDV